MGVHDGHRERLRNRFLTYGMDSLEDHEVLELLLQYAIHRKDTNPLAHALIERFGSLAKVMDASLSELLTVDGIGEHTAKLLLLCKPLCRRYRISSENTKEPLNTVDRCASFLMAQFFGIREEQAYLLCLDAKSRLICCRKLSEGSATATELPIRKAAQLALDSKAVCVILSHNHPNADCTPSHEDLILTKTLQETLDPLGIRLIDHIIVNGSQFHSMAQEGFFY